MPGAGKPTSRSDLNSNSPQTTKHDPFSGAPSLSEAFSVRSPARVSSVAFDKKLSMTTDRRPQSIRKSLSLTIVLIGAFIVLASVVAAIAKKNTAPLRVIPGGASLVLIGTVVYLRRVSEEKTLKVDSSIERAEPGATAQRG
jgi:hypothetical protein